MGVKFEPTAEQRKLVERMATVGLRQTDIATVIGVSLPTLHKAFREELDLGMAKGNAALARTMFAMATEDKIPSIVIFQAKVRLGMSERIVVQTQETPLRTATDADIAASVDLRRARLAALMGAGGSDSGEGSADPGTDGAVAPGSPA